MPSQLIANSNRELCDHGWVHNDRVATVQYSPTRIPKSRARKTTSITLTLQTPEEVFNRGVQLIDRGDFTGATDAFFSATQLQWNFTAAHIELGNARSALKLYHQALDAYNQAIETDPASVIAHYNLALTFFDLREFDQAQNQLRTIIQIDPKYPLAYTQLAKLSLASNQPNQALSQILFAARLTRPQDPNLLVQAGLIYEQINKPHHALRCYKRALKSDPWHAAAFYNRALNEYNAGRLNPAYISLAFALHTNPKYADALALLKKLRKELTPKKPRKPRKPAQHPLFSEEAAA